MLHDSDVLKPTSIACEHCLASDNQRRRKSQELKLGQRSQVFLVSWEDSLLCGASFPCFINFSFPFLDLKLITSFELHLTLLLQWSKRESSYLS